MGFISMFFPWGVILQALAIVHFIRRRPDGIWLWVIVFLGPIGALVYIFMEVLPDVTLLRQSFEGYGRRKRIKYLEGVVLQNPSAGNYEELADLYLDEGKFARARQCARMGGTRSGQEAGHAALPAAARTPLVQKGQGHPQASAEGRQCARRGLIVRQRQKVQF